jgi:hypothetical protein
MPASSKSWFYISCRKFDPPQYRVADGNRVDSKIGATHELFIAQSTGAPFLSNCESNSTAKAKQK